MIIDDKRSWWDVSVEALKALYKYNKQVCKAIIQDNDKTIQENLYKLTPLCWDEVHNFFSYLVKTNKEYVVFMLDKIDTNLLFEKWEYAITSSSYSHYSRKKSYVRGFRKLITLLQDNTESELFLHIINKVENILNNELAKGQ